jgi:hypothetical protein
MADKNKFWKRFGNFFCIQDGDKPKKAVTPAKESKAKNFNQANSLNHQSLSEKTALKTKTAPPNRSQIEAFLIDTSLQYPATENAEQVDLVIGFDLGTAWTKVVIQDTARRKAFAIPFKEYGSSNNPFLLPTKIGHSHGHLTLCKSNDPHQLCKDLKISLIENHDHTLKIVQDQEYKVTSSELNATFVALVLRYVRCFFMKNQAGIYKNNRLRWQLNLGIPVKNYDDTAIRDAFHQAALAGWWLSSQRGEIKIQSAKEAMQKIQDPDFMPGINRAFINVIPEVAAEVAGYAHSDLREEGLHLLIDIGATTLDVSTFVLDSNDGEDGYKFLTAEIGRFGAYELHWSRREAFKRFMATWVSKVDGIAETLEPIPESCNAYLPSATDIPNFDNDFIDKAAVPITRVVARTKRDRLPISPMWENGLPLFLCGGGSQAKFYSEKLVYKVSNSLNNIIWNGFRAKEIPKPANLEADGLRSHEYHRLAVAYGLSFQYEDIGNIVPPSDIGNIPRQCPRSWYEDRFISKDMV